mgnify:CR=1 FL=1
MHETYVKCTRCRHVYSTTSTDGPTVAPSERLAAEYGDDPRCRRCWGALACESLTRETEDLGLYTAEGNILTELAMIDRWMAAPSSDSADQPNTHDLLVAIRAALKGS